jgi:uncharacterized protein (TIGR02246 family)
MIARTPEDVDRLFGERVNACDVEGIVALYEPGATLVTPEAGPLVGHDAIREYLSPLPAMRPQIDMGVARVVQVTDDLAVVHHDFRLTLTGPDGSPMEIAGKATEIVRRQSDGSWRFLLDDPHMRD